MMQVPSPRWSEDDLKLGVKQAREIFRRERLEEPLDIYVEFFDQYRNPVENLLEESVDLSELVAVAQDYISDDDKRYALRYLAAPPISDDDLKTLADVNFSKKALDEDPDAVQRIVDTIASVYDRWRFPWVTDNREPTEAERTTAIISTASLIAASRAQTKRRNDAKQGQEDAIADALISIGYTEVPTRTIDTAHDAPSAGEFCRESPVGGSKADIIAGLHDHRIMAIEAKVSNSSTNSVKRINREAAAKAATWLTKFGSNGIVPTAVISGVFKVHNLETAQQQGLTIFWAHDLAQLVQFVESTKP